MELNKSIWTNEDIHGFLEYLTSLKNPQKVEFSRNIINTKLPMLAIPIPALRKIANQIIKGNFMSFLDANINDYYEAEFINGLLICKIKDFDIFRNWLVKYSRRIDNWACCDSLQFNINNQNIEKYFSLSKKMFASSFEFERRIGVRIWFNLINTDYLNNILDLINASNQNEDAYYVNMVLAWFLCECFIKKPDLTKKYLKSHHLNTFTLRKFVSKCQDSYRISIEDKKQLKSLLK